MIWLPSGRVRLWKHAILWISADWFCTQRHPTTCSAIFFFMNWIKCLILFLFFPPPFCFRSIQCYGMRPFSFKAVKYFADVGNTSHKCSINCCSLPDVNKCPLHASGAPSAEELCGEIVMVSETYSRFGAIELPSHSCICVLNQKRERQMAEWLPYLVTCLSIKHFLTVSIDFLPLFPDG